MHSIHRSRGRILFEVFCALAVSASFVGAWMQTGASALLGAAAVTALYGLWHLTDLAAPKEQAAFRAEEPIVEKPALSPQSAEPETVVMQEPAVVMQEPVEQEPAPGEAVGHVELAGSTAAAETDPVERPARRKSPAKRARKAPPKRGSRASATAEAKVIDLVAAEAPAIELDPPPPSEEDVRDEGAQPHIAPLFEPDPFVRMPRQAFGRRGRI